MAKEFGLGQVSNLGFENEKKGIIPSKKWKKETIKERWYAGETLNSAIGQGYTSKYSFTACSNDSKNCK